MQSLGLSESPPKTENRLKSLLWPSIESGADVDYLGSQGYWICFAVAIVNLAVSLIAAHPIMAALSVLFYFLGGVGVRERDICAAAIAPQVLRGSAHLTVVFHVRLQSVSQFEFGFPQLQVWGIRHSNGDCKLDSPR